MSGIVWSEDQEDEIIAYVRAHPCFYDTSSADYKNREIRSAEWEKLAAKYAVDAGAMQRKWKALNDTFKRCEKQSKEKKSGDGADAPFQPKWVHYEKLKFLSPYRAPRETQTSIQRRTGGPDQSQEEPIVIDDEGTGRVLTQKEMPPPGTPIATNKKRKLGNVPSSPAVDDLFRKTLSQITEQMSKEPSEVQLFTDHVGSQLNTLSLRRQLRAKDAIQHIVSEALDEQYAEEDELERMRSSPHVLLPTQQQQSQYYHHYSVSTGPPPTSSSYSGHETPLSTTASLLSEVGTALYPNSHY